MASSYPDSTPLDAEAMRRTAQGDLEAFGEIIHRHQTMLVNFFCRLGASMADAEDLAQETFLRLYQWRSRYRPIARFTTFLLTLARHAWVDGLRKQMRSPRTVGDGELPAQMPHREVGVAATERHLDIRQALAALTEKLREVVVLSVYHGLNYQEIGETLGIPEGTVKSRMFHALRRLREILGSADNL
jgi:RNA polymerase sigma-70 factor, ECF subfamily